MSRQAPPSNPNAEAALIGAILVDPDTLDGILGTVNVGDFATPIPQLVYAAIVRCAAAGRGVDETTVAESLRATGNLDRVGGLRALLAFAADSPAQANVAEYARIVAGLARWRRAIAWSAQVNNAAYEAAADDGKALERLLAESETLLAAPLDEVVTTELLDLLAQPDPIPKPWVIPALLRAQENLVLTGGEGAGKMTLLRMFAMGVASGVHPFTDLPMRRQSVLIIDLQEDMSELRSELAFMHRHVAKHYRPGMLNLVCRRQGIDLLGAHDGRWFESLLAKHQPALVVLGPLKKMYRPPVGRGLWDDDVIEALHRKIDEWQVRYGFAMCLEGHAGHDRETWRVKGSSAWYGWPHFGMGVDTSEGLWTPRDFKLTRWRGDRDSRVKRFWPTRIIEHDGWPWRANPVAMDEMRKVQQAGEMAEQPALEEGLV